MNTPVYIVEESYYKQIDKSSWSEYTHSIMSVHKNLEDALDVLRKIHMEAARCFDTFDVELNEKAYCPYVIYRWMNGDSECYERIVQIITRDLT